MAQLRKNAELCFLPEMTPILECDPTDSSTESSKDSIQSAGVRSSGCGTAEQNLFRIACVLDDIRTRMDIERSQRVECEPRVETRCGSVL
jgi:hypothetical protein